MNDSHQKGGTWFVEDVELKLEAGKVHVHLERIPDKRSGYFAVIAWENSAADAIRPCDTH